MLINKYMQLSLLSYIMFKLGPGEGGGGGGGQLKCVNDVSSGHEYMYMHALSMHAILKVGFDSDEMVVVGYIIWRVIVNNTPLLKITYLQHDLLD